MTKRKRGREMTQEEREYALQPSINHPLPIDTQIAIAELINQIEQLKQTKELLRLDYLDENARAEAAEAELKEAIKDIPNICETCYLNGRCNFDTQCFGTNMENWKWRGARKEGEK